MLAGSSVLIVDDSRESREVLRTALERRGLRVLEAAQSADGLALARLHHPDLIVLDLEAEGLGSRTADEFASVAQHDHGTLLILGTAPRQCNRLAGEFIAKPYHYKPLVLKIEELLGQRRRRAAA